MLARFEYNDFLWKYVKKKHFFSSSLPADDSNQDTPTWKSRNESFKYLSLLDESFSILKPFFKNLPVDTKKYRYNANADFFNKAGIIVKKGQATLEKMVIIHRQLTK